MDPYYIATTTLRGHLGTLLSSVPTEPLGDYEDDSPAARELAQESTWVGRGAWGSDPLRQAHVSGYLALRFAQDCGTGMVRLVADDPVSVYGFLVLGRAVLEGSAKAYFLLDPDIPIERRLARGMNERLTSLYAQAKLEGIPNTARQAAKNRAAEILDEATRLNLPLSKSGTMLSRGSKKITDQVKALLSNIGSDVGQVIYSWYTSVAHAGLMGLSQSITVADQPSTEGYATGAVTASSTAANIALAATIWAFGRGSAQCQAFTGLVWAGWPQVLVNATRAASRTIGSLPRA